MRKLLVLVCAAAFISLATTDNAIADSIKGRLGVTGKIGFLIPNESDYAPIRNNSEAGLLIGGGFIYGVDDRFAAVFEISHGDYNSGFGVTDFSLGGQYRFVLEKSKLVPYLGAGLDLLMSYADQGRDVDTTIGFHASGGIDYFIMKELALIAEARIVIAPEADIKGPSGKLGNFDPTAFSTIVGVRYFFN